MSANSSPAFGVEKTAEGIHAAWAADKNYGSYAGISMASVVFGNPGRPVHLHLFSDGVDQRDIAKMESMASKAGGTLSVYDIGPRLNETIARVDKHHYSRAAFGRLFISEMLPRSVTRILYFDCDVICIDKLDELWFLGREIKCLGAAKDLWVDLDTEYKKKVGVPEANTYFNSGVMLIAIDAWRERNICAELIKYTLARETSTYLDQDAINVLLGPEITPLAGRWNVLATSPYPSELQKTIAAAANIHFVGALKPWHLGYRVLAGTGADAFLSAKRRSPWSRKLPDPQIKRVRRKLREIYTERFSKK